MNLSFLQRLKKRVRRALEWVKLHRESACDANRYFGAASWAGPVKKHELAHIHAELIKHYHVVEKGLTMPDFRPRFGVGIVRRLVELVSVWKNAGGEAGDYHLRVALTVVQAYYQKHTDLRIDVSDLISEDLLEMNPWAGERKYGGEKEPMSVTQEVLSQFDQIALSRHSVRQFEISRQPEHQVLKDAVEVALSTPSVCNRQTWRVHFFEGESAQNVLSLQNGNRGFGHAIPTVAIVTSDMRYFAGGPERYQGWIEGGLFSMSFLLSLHARGLSSVALNWSCLNQADRKLRELSGIPSHERVIMIIGLGYAKPGHVVPSSPRSPVENFVAWH